MSFMLPPRILLYRFRSITFRNDFDPRSWTCTRTVIDLNIFVKSPRLRILQVGSLAIIDYKRFVIFVLFFMKEQYGLSCRVMNRCFVGSLYELELTSWMDSFSVTQSLRKRYFCCLVIRLYLVPLVLFLVMFKIIVIPCYQPLTIN